MRSVLLLLALVAAGCASGSGQAVPVSEERFKEDIESGRPYLVLFTVSYEGVAAMEGAARALRGRARCIILRLAEARSAFAEHRVSSPPTFILFVKGKEVCRRSDAVGAEELVEWVAEHLPKE